MVLSFEIPYFVVVILEPTFQVLMKEKDCMCLSKKDVYLLTKYVHLWICLWDSFRPSFVDYKKDKLISEYKNFTKS